MTKADIIKKIALLESRNDQIYTELLEVDKLMRQVGFDNGLATIKLTAKELYISEQKNKRSTKKEF